MHFVTGVFATLLATPCSGPFLGVVLGWSVKQPPSIVYLVWDHDWTRNVVSLSHHWNLPQSDSQFTQTWQLDDSSERIGWSVSDGNRHLDYLFSGKAIYLYGFDYVIGNLGWVLDDQFSIYLSIS